LRPVAAPLPQLIGLKAKLYAKKRHSEKVVMKRTIAQHSERTNKHKAEEEVAKGAIPHYLLDREQVRAPLQCAPSLRCTHGIASRGAALGAPCALWSRIKLLLYEFCFSEAAHSGAAELAT